MFDGLSFDPFTLFDYGFRSAEVGVCRRHVAQAFVIALVVIVFDERFDLDLEIARQEVVLQQNTVLERLVPAFDLALRLRMEGRARAGCDRCDHYQPRMARAARDAGISDFSSIAGLVHP